MLHFLQHSAPMARCNAEMLQVLQQFIRRLGETAACKVLDRPNTQKMSDYSLDTLPAPGVYLSHQQYVSKYSLLTISPWRSDSNER